MSAEKSAGQVLRFQLCRPHSLIDRVVVHLTPGADAQSDEARKAQDEAKQKRATVQD